MKLFAKKSLGQHFLTSTHVLEQIIDAAKIQKGETVLEIGPGTGILTRALLDSGASVIAIEKDARAIELLKEKFSKELSENRFKVVEGDILSFDQKKFEDVFSFFHFPFSIVSNIPYYITGAILEQFLEHGPRPSRMVLLVQKEVAERIVARDGKESILSVSVKAFGTPKLIVKVPPGAFNPPPKVDSAIIAIENISDARFTQKNIDVKRFFAIVKSAFAHKRKLAARNLESIMDKNEIQSAWIGAGLDPKIRAEDIATEVWLKISENKS